MTTKKALALVEKAESDLKAAKKALNDLRGRRRILCSCGKFHAINKLEVIITSYYNEPYSCTGGDYWSEGEWQFLCPVEGPTKGQINRFMFDDCKVKYDNRRMVGKAAEPTFKQLYDGLFAPQKRIQGNGTGEFYNNYYIDKNRGKFELPLAPEEYEY